MNHTVKEIRAAMKRVGIKGSGTKDELLSLIADWLGSHDYSEVKAAVEANDNAVLTSMVPHAYRLIRADQVQTGMFTHNGYCTDSISDVTMRQPERRHTYVVSRGYHVLEGKTVYVTYSLHGSKVQYKASQTIHVSLRSLLANPHACNLKGI